MSRSFIAELVVSHPDLPLMPTVRDVADVDIQVESQPLTRTDGGEPNVFFSVSDSQFRDFESALDTDHTVADWHVTLEFTDCRVYQIRLSSDAKFITPEMASLGVQILSIRNADVGWQFRLQAPDRERLSEYWEYCRDEDVQFQLEKIYSSGPRAVHAAGQELEALLTDRQREVAQTVARMGYYEPDGASAAAVAAELEISRSTLSTHLRRILAKIFHYLFSNSVSLTG